MTTLPTVSVVLPTYRREKHLVDTITALLPLLQRDDELLVVDQTPRHEAETESYLLREAGRGSLRWFRRNSAGQCGAMNAAALLSKGDVLLFLDDDIIPSPGLLEGHRKAFDGVDEPPATCGQVLQPWHEGPVASVTDFEIGFDAAYAYACEIVSLMEGNFAMRRETFLRVGGMDESFRGATYRHGLELAFRLRALTGRRARFVPEASLRHLWAGGGNRAYGTKDSWGMIEGSIGDYYFALKCLPAARAARHILRRLLRAPLNRATLGRPHVVLSLACREVVALVRAAWRRRRPLPAVTMERYADLQEAPLLSATSS